MSDDRLAVLLEDIQSKLDNLVEAATITNERLTRVEQTISVIPNIAADVEKIKLVQTEQGKQQRQHHEYLTGLGMPQRA